LELIAERYQIERELGRGGMGVVYLAHDEVLDRYVAIKVVNDPSLGKEGRDRLLREARLAAQLNHLNIVAIHDAIETDDTPQIVMEYVEGKSTHDQPPRDLDQILDIATQLCNALSHAHQQGIVHRDLKPENVLLTEDGTVKLTDFGLATLLASRISSDGIVFGTTYYIAPETVQRQPIDARTDLYAFGVMLYEWCTGQLPFTASDPLAIITQHLFTPPLPPRAKAPDLPNALDQLILRLMSKSPDERPASAQEVREILTAPGLLRDEAVEPPEIPTLDRIGRGRMAGRENELQQARTLWGRAMTGKGQALLLSGEAGIGKTRLVRELIAQAELSGAQVLQGLNDAQVAQPLGAFRQTLRGPLEGRVDSWRTLPGYVVADLLTLAPEYHSHFPELTVPPTHDTVHEQQHLFESLAVYLSMLSDQTPVLLVMEDLQWADSGTLYLLRYLVGQMRERPIMFILTFREVEAPEASVLQEVLLDFRRQHQAQEITLTRLNREQTHAMLEALLGEDLAPNLVDKIYGITEGNPFFIEEFCKSLVAKGRLIYKDDRWQVRGKKALEVPKNVRVTIQGRIRMMTPETQQVLEAAAVRGPLFEHDLLRRAEPLDEARLGEALRSAEQAQIIQELPTENGQRFGFTHALIPAAILEGMPITRRQSLHAKIAPMLEVSVPDDYETLASQYQAAGVRDKAIKYLLLAGERAYGVYACREALQHYSRALELQVDLKEEEAAARTLLRMGLVYSADFQFEEAQRAYEQAFDLWEEARRYEAEDRAIKTGETLRFAIDEPLSLDPGLSGDDPSAFLVGQLFEGLVEIDEAAGILPALAARWDVSQDGRRYTFYLREGRQWSDGSALTASDFEYAWRRNLTLGPHSTVGLLLADVENAQEVAAGRMEASQLGVEARGEHTLEVRLEGPAAYFPLLLAHPATSPLPRHVVEGERQPWTEVASLVGNGPYLLTESIPGDRIVLERNPHYRGISRGNVERIEAPLISQYEPFLKAFDKGTLDGINLANADPASIRKLTFRYRSLLRLSPKLSTLYLAFRADRPPFDDEMVRLAFVKAVDKTAVLRQTGAAQFKPALGGFLPPGMPGHSPSIGPKVDEDAARQSLAEAGYAQGEGFPGVELLYSGSSEPNPIPGMLQELWNDVLGVRVEINSLVWSEFIERQDHDPPDIAINGWEADYPDPNSMLRLLFHSGDGLNPGRWANQQFDSLIEEAARISDRKRRLELYQEADQILVTEQAAVMPLSYARGRQLVKSYVQLPRTSSSMLRLKHAVVQHDGD
jgi:ABC-type oligopeptide transport system substrate-binding subunit/predicted Ser/Thr protein kinase